MQGRPRFSPFAIPPSAAQSQSVVTEATSELGSEPEPELPPMSPIPAQPPICFVDFTNLVGFSNIPRRIARFFYRREDVRRGAEAGLSIVLGTKNDAREFQAGDRGTIPRDPPQGHDLDWGLEEEAYYPSTFFKTISNIEKWRKSYYEELRKELKASREIARGIREPTKAESATCLRVRSSSAASALTRKSNGAILSTVSRFSTPLQALNGTKAGEDHCESWCLGLRMNMSRVARRRLKIVLEKRHQSHRSNPIHILIYGTADTTRHMPHQLPFSQPPASLTMQRSLLCMS